MRKKTFNIALISAGLSLLLFGFLDFIEILSINYFQQVVIGLFLIKLVGFLKLAELILKRISRREFVENSEFKLFTISEDMLSDQIIDEMKSENLEPVTLSDLQNFYKDKKLFFPIIALGSAWDDKNVVSDYRSIPYIEKISDLDRWIRIKWSFDKWPKNSKFLSKKIA